MEQLPVLSDEVMKRVIAVSTLVDEARLIDKKFLAQDVTHLAMDPTAAAVFDDYTTALEAKLEEVARAREVLVYRTHGTEFKPSVVDAMLALSSGVVKRYTAAIAQIRQRMQLLRETDSELAKAYAEHK